MHRDAYLLDWARAITCGRPTWLEIVASHVRARSVPDGRNDRRVVRLTEESSNWMKRIRPAAP